MAAPPTFLSTRAARAMLFGAAAGAALIPTRVTAQAGCAFGDGTTEQRIQPDPRGGSIYRTENAHFVCDDDVEIWADSTVFYGFDQMSILYGSVRYQDRQREMNADNARYFVQVGRLQAQGHVFVTNFEDGSTIENGDLVYLRQTDYRDVEEMTVTRGADGVRPRATVYPKRAQAPADTTGVEPLAAQPPDVDPVEPDEYIVVGNRLFFRGDSYFTATGTVEIERDSLFAHADSAEYSGDQGQLLLDGSARVEGTSYDLVGRTITLTSAADGTDEVHALRDAELNGEDLRVTAAQIMLDLVEGEVEHLVAVPLPADLDGAADPPAPRPIAISQDIELTGDSLDLAAPGGVIQRIFAAGTARSVSSDRPELNVEALPELARTDWMDGDTIEVLLEPVQDSTVDFEAGAEPASEYEVERIIARVGARSLYRLLPSDSTAVPGVDPPAVSYMVADQITIFMVGGQADRVESVGEVSGWHLEPLQRAPPDSSAAPAADDSIAVPPLASTVPSQGNGGDGQPFGAYLSPSSPTQQRRRFQ